MDSDSEGRSAGTDLINARISQSSNVSVGAGSSISSDLSGLGNHSHCTPSSDNDYHLPYRYSEPLPMPDTSTRSTSLIGPSSLSEAHASGLDPTGAPLIETSKPSHRNPCRRSQSQPDPVSSNLRRSSSQDQLKKPGEGPTFSPPSLHPLSLRTKRSREHSPFPAQKPRDNQKPKRRFTLNPSPPNSPVELEPEQGYPIPRSPSGSSGSGLDALDDPRLFAKDGVLPDQEGGERVEKVEQICQHQHD